MKTDYPGQVRLGIILGVLISSLPLVFSNSAAAQETVSPVKAMANRDAYFPATEDLGPDEMRIISLGTAMPFQRPAQAAPSFLVELGNGDKFLFDIGTGAAERLAALQIPYDYLNKVFLGHLHADHMGDLPALWVGGTINNRTVPLEIWGPTGASPGISIRRHVLTLDKNGVKRRFRVRWLGRCEWSLPEGTTT